MGDEPERARATGAAGAAAAAVLLAAAMLAFGCASPPLLIDQEPSTGFAIYRSGRLTRSELAELCAAGVREMVVLDGTAADRECRWRDQLCPGLRIRYDRKQDPRVPVETGFLDAFDAWVESARSEGRKIAFRCHHGWHRAGRLAAWYRMRFESRPAGEAIEEMLRVGRFMNHYRELIPQVQGLEDLVAGRPCRHTDSDCPRDGGNNGFTGDACR